MYSLPTDARWQRSMLGVAAIFALSAAIFAQDVPAYLCIAVPAMLPIFLWLRAGGAGMPILPIISGLFFIYYAIPLLRHQMTTSDSAELLQAAITVASFLIAASLTCWPFLGRMRRAAILRHDFISENEIVPLVFIGLGGGIIFHAALISGSLNWLDSALGLVRAIVLTLTSMACYLIGYARASRVLVGERWGLAVGGLLALVVLALSNLLLIGGLMYCLAGFLGYVVRAKRVPWGGVIIAFALLATLHAGKFEVRKTYWESQGGSVQVSVSQVPGMMADWFAAGVQALWSGGGETDVLQRASLLHMLVLVQRATPDFIPYLEGETYRLLPSMLVPRFLDPDKTMSQAGLNLLSIRYGLQTTESTMTTTIGWGLVTEAYANFGSWGVIVIGALFGGLCGGLMRVSSAASPNSLAAFVTIAATLILLNLEADFAYLLTTLSQTVTTVLIIGALAHLVRGQRRAVADPDVEALPAQEPLLGETPLP